jgi:hypothetical protein
VAIVDKKQLSQLGHLNREIEILRRQIQALNSETTIDSVKGSSANFPFTLHTIKIQGVDWKSYESRMKRLSDQLSRRVSELMDLLEEINEYIAAIDDSEMRQILTLRYVNGFTWQQVAAHIGGGNTADGVKKACYRFLQKN